MFYLVSVTGQFNWLINTLVFDSEQQGLLPHPLFSELCDVIKLVSDTELIVNFTTCSDNLRYEPDVYLYTAYEWLHSIASYSMLNIESCRRLVSYFLLIIFILKPFLVHLHFAFCVVTCDACRCCCYYQKIR